MMKRQHNCEYDHFPNEFDDDHDAACNMEEMFELLYVISTITVFGAYCDLMKFEALSGCLFRYRIADFLGEDLICAHVQNCQN